MHHSPPVDRFANAPDWLPWTGLTEIEDAGHRGYAYWWDGTAWRRAPYPEDLTDDGLDMDLTRISDEQEALGEILDAIFEAGPAGADQTGAGGIDMEADVRRTGQDLLRHAHAGTVTPAVVEAVLGRLGQTDEVPGVPAALRAAERAGLAPGSALPELAAGAGRTAEPSCSAAQR
ncbi:hypothetical protein [Streptomyces sp. NPDC021212]|uniref:hypothetical protein n=1 Tax=Streptomyces sp. NPDC021212 TaxID=3365118 RepID=UPI0037B0E1E9